MFRYYYLIYSLFFLALVIIVLSVRKDLRAKSISALIWGAVGGPAIEIFDYHDYWKPYTLLGRGHVSIEDVIFGASISALAFTIYPVLAKKGLSESRLSSKQQRQRIIAHGAGMVLLFSILFWGFHINSVFAVAIVLLSGWLVQIWQRRDLLKPGLWVGGLFVLLAALVYGLGFSVVGRQTLQTSWLLFGKPGGQLLLGRIPFSELIWFFAVGCFLSIFDLYTSGKVYIKLHQERRAGRPKTRAVASRAGGKNDKA